MLKSRVFRVFFAIFGKFRGLGAVSEGVVGSENCGNSGISGVLVSSELGVIRDRVKIMRDVFEVKR